MRRSSGCVLAIDAGGTFLKAALVLHDGQVVEESFMRIAVDSQAQVPDIQGSYTSLSATACAYARRADVQIDAVGVCIPGPFDYVNGVSLMTHKYAAINGLSLRPWLASSLEDGTPIRFIHDSNAFLLGALQGGRFAEVRNAAGVTIGTGLGFATLLDGSLVTAPNGGPYVSIYARPYMDGVSEDYVSRRAILSAYAKLKGSAADADVAEIADRARAGEPEALRVFCDTGRHLGAILHDIAAQYRLECLLLGGAISKSAELMLPELRGVLADLPHLAVICKAEDIDMAPIKGAALTALATL